MAPRRLDCLFLEQYYVWIHVGFQKISVFWNAFPSFTKNWFDRSTEWLITTVQRIFLIVKNELSNIYHRNNSTRRIGLNVNHRGKYIYDGETIGDFYLFFYLFFSVSRSLPFSCSWSLGVLSYSVDTTWLRFVASHVLTEIYLTPRGLINVRPPVVVDARGLQREEQPPRTDQGHRLVHVALAISLSLSLLPSAPPTRSLWNRVPRGLVKRNEDERAHEKVIKCLCTERWLTRGRQVENDLVRFVHYSTLQRKDYLFHLNDNLFSQVKIESTIIISSHYNKFQIA